MNEVLINTPIGEILVDINCVKKQISKNYKISIKSNTYFIKDENLNWSISKIDLDKIVIDLRNEKIESLINTQNL